MGRREKGISSHIFVANQGRRQELNVANTTRNTLERKGGSDTKRGEQTVKPRLNVGFGLGYHFVWRLRNTKVRLIMGVVRIFQRGGGGHTVSNRGYSRFRNLNIVGCLSEKRLTKEGSRAPQDPPPPSYALADYLLYGCMEKFHHFFLSYSTNIPDIWL